MRLSSKKNIQELAALMVAHGVHDVVLCPGSRNAPLVQTFSQIPEMRCHPATDERSAGFMAMGMALATGCITAVCVTSGSALLNLHPAVAEASYQRVPMLVISADRPACWIGQMDGQTMPQPGALGEMVRMSVQLPEVHTSDDLWHVNRLCNEALLQAVRHGGGPVHINVPISEPVYEFEEGALPQVRKIERTTGIDATMLQERLLAHHRCLLIVGQERPQAWNGIADDGVQGMVTLTEHLSNLGNKLQPLTDMDTLASCIPEAEAEAYRPDLVITLGGHIISKHTKMLLRRYPPCEHWHISPDGEVADLLHGALTWVIEGDAHTAIQQLQACGCPHADHDYVARWRALQQRVAELPASATAPRQMTGLLMGALPHDAVLHLANSSAVRYAQHYALPPSVTVCCNRGINGIEGSLSAAVGYATVTPDRPHYVVIGDLSFFYDQNALWNTELPQNLHILLLNSGGGDIFGTLPGMEDTSTGQRYICATHRTEAAAVARQYGLQYMRITTPVEWDAVRDDFINSKQSIILEYNERLETN